MVESLPYEVNDQHDNIRDALGMVLGKAITGCLFIRIEIHQNNVNAQDYSKQRCSAILLPDFCTLNVHNFILIQRVLPYKTT